MGTNTLPPTPVDPPRVPVAGVVASDAQVAYLLKHTQSLKVDDTMADAHGNIDAVGYVDLNVNCSDSNGSVV